MLTSLDTNVFVNDMYFHLLEISAMCIISLEFLPSPHGKPIGGWFGSDVRDVNFANVIEYCTDLRGSPRKLKVLGSSSETLPLLLILCGVTGGIVFVLVVALAVIMCAKRTAARQKGNARPGRCHIATQDWRPFGEIKLEIFALTRGAFGFSLIYVAGIVPVFFSELFCDSLKECI